jgi:glycosyltransferase involved in cell wall biosynthesis
MIPLVYPAYFSATQRLIYYLAHSLALRTARVAMAISQTTRADLIRYFRLDPQRIVVTPLAADAHFQPQPPERIAAARLKYTLPERYVLYLGSNKPHKNLVRLVSAWQVASCRPALEAKRGGLQVADYKLVIAGQWDVRYPQARGRAEELGLKDQVLFAGPVDDADLPALYSGASLFVFASEYEGFGLPALEAMASGVPVVCSNTSSLPEVAGDAALLVDPLDTGALAAAIERALTDADLRQALREKGVVQAARFSWEQTAQATLAVYAQASA